MSMVTAGIGEELWPRSNNRIGSAGNTAAVVTLDSTSPLDSMAYRFRAPKSGNIKKFHIVTNTVTTGATLDVECQTVDSNFAPSGTPVTNGTTTLVIADADDNVLKSATFATAPTVTAGTVYAAVFKAPSSGSLNLQIRSVFNNSQVGRGVNNVLTALNAGAWFLAAMDAMVFGVEYDDGSFAYIPNTMPFLNPANDTFSSATIKGNRFKYPAPRRVIGWWADFTMASASASDFVVHIYNSSGTSLRSQSYEASILNATSANVVVEYFDTYYDIAANTTYYIAVAPSSANSITLQRFDSMTATAAALDQCIGGQDMCAASLSGGTWTNDTDSRYMMGLIFGGLDDGAGGGGLLRHPGMAGGMNG